MAQSTDDLFASLGGSLMKDLFEDLQVDENDLNADGMGWSLEQLERELAHLDDAPPPEQPSFPPPSTQPPPGLSAASLVVSHAQQRSVNDDFTTATTVPTSTTSAADAWSQSLEKFTALSLEADFLAADSARKQKPAPVSNNMAFLAGAKDYDIAEPLSLGPPPGLSTSPPAKPAAPASTTPSRPPGMPSPPARKPMTKVVPQQSVPVLENEEQGVAAELDESKTQIPKPPPATPQNSISLPVSNRPLPPTPHNSFAVWDDEPEPQLTEIASPVQVKQLQEPVAEQQQPKPAQQPPPPQPPRPAQQQPPPQRVQQQQPPPQMMQQQSPPPQMMPRQQPPPQMIQEQMARPGVAWQTPAKPPPAAAPPHQPVYCQSHPMVPPIPAGALESTYMKARDITYVLHSMLKPVLLMGVSPSDYNIMLLTLQAQGQQVLQQKKSKNKDDIDDKSTPTAPTISMRSKEWMEKHSTLGHVSRTDVTRPRALIATTLVKEEEQAAEKNKNRANLWKSRLYIDQAYQAFTNIVEIWKAAPPGKAPPEIQPHLLRLYKYLGISPDYKVDPQALRLVCKLSKGRTLLARILEQALLPPHAVQALLPVAFQILLSNSGENNPSDDRVFRVSAQILSSLPSLEASTVMESVQTFLDNPKYALATTPRMECVHVLLRRGNAMAQSNPEFAPEWDKTEQEFLKMLGSM